MLIKTKINFKLYLLLSVPLVIGAMFLVDGMTQRLCILLIYVATIINQLLLIEIVFQLLSSNLNKDEKPPSGLKLAMMFLIKIAIIFGAISFSVQFMGNKIIIPVINYVIQIFMFSVSINRED